MTVCFPAIGLHFKHLELLKLGITAKAYVTGKVL